MHANSRPVVSNQQTTHNNLLKVVNRNATSEFRRPISKHSHQEFQTLLSWLDSFRQEKQKSSNLSEDENNDRKNGRYNIIFDAGCGNGKSSAIIATRFPDSLVVGVDKSYARLAKTEQFKLPTNLFYLRSDLIDFYRLACEHSLRPYRHYILYPNPWPKAEHLQRRWHGSGIFKNIVSLGGELELRSNWKIYLDEFAEGLTVFDKSAVVSALSPSEANTAFNAKFISDFEEKYFCSGQALWQLRGNLRA